MLHPLKSSQTTKQQSQNQTVWLLPQFKVRMIILKWLTDKRIFLLSMDSNGFENPKTEHYTHCLQQTIIHAYKKNQSFLLKSLVGKRLKAVKIESFIGEEVADLHRQRSDTFLVRLFCKSSLLRTRCPSCKIQSRSSEYRTDARRNS